MPNYPEPFDHPEFVKYPSEVGITFVPQKETSFQFNGISRIDTFVSKEGHTLTEVLSKERGFISRIFTAEDVSVTTQYSADSSFTTVICVANVLVKRELHKNGGFLEETWFEKVNEKLEIKAIRRSTNGLLSNSDDGCAAVVRTFNPCVERREVWDNGVLKKVLVVDHRKVLYEEVWNEGKCFSDTWDDYSKSYFPSSKARAKVAALVNASGLARPAPVTIPVSKKSGSDEQTPQPTKEVETPPHPKEVETPQPIKEVETPQPIKLITAKQAKEMCPMTLDDIIRSFNESVAREGPKAPHGSVRLNAYNNSLLRDMKMMLRDAGYQVYDVVDNYWLRVEW